MFFVSRLVDLRSGSERRMQLRQIYRSGSTRSVFIPERELRSLRVYGKPMAVAVVGVGLRILIQSYSRGVACYK